VSADPVAAIARAVLYEGYVLWPYRRSATKNRQRWTFGGVHPESWSRAHPDDRCAVQAQCLLEGPADVAIDVAVRFLQVVRRRPVDASGAPVDELDGVLAWDEARERETTLLAVAGAPARAAIDIPAGRDVEPVAGGTLVRTWQALAGTVDVALEPIAAGLHRLTARVANTTPFDGGDRDDALRRTLASTHVVLRSADGAFVSQTDPPDELRDAAAACENVGVWPVLVADRHTMLASPIVLPDHPQIAPESPGDLFDGCEIDQLLVLNILALTDDERREARASDPRAREILDRCAALGPDDLMRLHGVLREP
jgi:hydrogenase maturation protease